LGNVIHGINQTITAVAPEKAVVLELVRWETHAFPAGGPPQAVINRHIGDYDIFVGIMWRRFGTPTDEAGSGTEEEFNRANAQFQQTGVPHVMFYFCQAPAPPPRSAQEIEQLSRVVSFRDRLSSLALVWEYATHEDFADTVRPHLLQGLARVLASGGQTKSLALADDKTRLFNLRHRLKELATKYARTRESMPASDQRTRQLELVATEIRASAFDGAPLIAEFVNSSLPEERLIAAIFLQVTPRLEYFSWLGERLSEKQPFIGYHSAVAFLAAARTAECSSRKKLRSAINLGIERLGPKTKTDRNRVLRAALAVIETRCGS
jgi:hypothetical protein